jgi:Protein of unknown function (DUF4038)/Putative collagen-binding domain of a collagenase
MMIGEQLSRRRILARSLGALAALILPRRAKAQEQKSVSGRYPLSVSPNGRYLVSVDGRPFFMVADSCQGGAVESLADFEYYLDVRQAQGFNTIQFNLIVTPNVGNTNPNYQTNSGLAPFSGAKVSTPNPTYFALMREFVSLLARYGMVAWLNPYETGLGKTGGMRDLAAAGATACQTYGAYVATVFRDFPNVMWHFGNDYEGGRNDQYVGALMEGVRSVAPKQLRGGELSFSPGDNNPSNSFGYSPKLVPYLNLNGTYTYGPAYYENLIAYNAPSVSFAARAGNNTIPPSPVILVETNYEFERNLDAYDLGNARNLRLAAWWNYLSGACGYIYGNGFTATTFRSNAGDNIKGPYNRTQPCWKNNLNTAAANQFAGILQAFFTRMAWYNLIPDQTHVVGTAGYGTPSANNPYATNNYVTLAATSDGTLAVAYFPQGNANTLTLNMASFVRPVTAQWFDPTDGTYSTIRTFSNTGSQDFSPPGSNSVRDPDWVLVLTA